MLNEITNGFQALAGQFQPSFQLPASVNTVDNSLLVEILSSAGFQHATGFCFSSTSWLVVPSWFTLPASLYLPDFSVLESPTQGSILGPIDFFYFVLFCFPIYPHSLGDCILSVAFSIPSPLVLTLLSPG